MQAPVAMLSVWNQFRGVPMESFTKGWWHRRCGGAPRQRSIAEMVEHRQAYGAGGNCFDLALWLRHEFQRSGIPARVVGHDLSTPNAHVAVAAQGLDGEEYLCDLGDLWLQPILIDTESAAFSTGWHAGFFPGREIQVSRTGDQVEISYRRASAKVSRQCFDLRPIPEEELQRACDYSQNLLRRPVCEMLLTHPETGLLEHWEYDKGASFWNLADGLTFEAPCATAPEWADRICARSGLSPALILEGFAAYQT